MGLKYYRLTIPAALCSGSERKMMPLSDLRDGLESSLNFGLNHDYQQIDLNRDYQDFVIDLLDLNLH
jgi:hypothetical protein